MCSTVPPLSGCAFKITLRKARVAALSVESFVRRTATEYTAAKDTSSLTRALRAVVAAVVAIRASANLEP